VTRIIDGYDVDALAARARGREYQPDAGAEVERLLADPEIAALPSLAARRPVPRPPRSSILRELAAHAPVRAAEPGEVR
jgi:hypothetical protein